MGLCGSTEAEPAREAKSSSTKSSPKNTTTSEAAPIVGNARTEEKKQGTIETEAYVQSVTSGTSFICKIGIGEQPVRIRGVIGHASVAAEARRELSSIIVAKNVQMKIHKTVSSKGDEKKSNNKTWIADVTIGQKDVVGQLVKLGLVTLEEDCGVKKWLEYEATAKEQKKGVFSDKPKKKGHRRSKSRGSRGGSRKSSTGKKKKRSG